MSHDVFLGFRTAQRGDAARIKAHMNERGLSVVDWADTTSMDSHDAIEASAIYALLIGPHTFAPSVEYERRNPYVFAEAEFAYRAGKRILPVLLQGGDLQNVPTELSFLKRTQAERLRPEPDFLPDLEDLITKLLDEVQKPARRHRPAAPTSPIDRGEAGQVFISHSTVDGALEAAALAGALEAEGVRCWIAPRDVEPGKTYPGQIVRAIERCRALVLMLTPEADRSADVLQEVQIAHSAKKLVVPVIIRHTVPGDDIRYFISVRHQILWSDGQSTANRVRGVI